MKSLSQTIAESLKVNEASKYKDFKDVKVGDIVVDIDDYNDELGKIVFIGTIDQILSSTYKTLLAHEDEIDTHYPKEDDYVVIKHHKYGNTIVNYAGRFGGVVLK